ncbi:two-component system histidine kinase PnpS [Chryseomicrobium palamuruense]|uniref:histidine kinase n=1 Tax=Chryseomicrobium palamuruense TaxID=682973 RepID=A0ABV8UYU5_9BACL
MKTFYSRLLLVFAVLYAILLSLVGIVLGQLFPIVIRQRVELHSSREEASEFMQWISEDSVIYSTLLSVVLLVFYVASLWITSLVIARYIKPIDDISQTAIQLADGNYTARVYEDDLTGITPLTNSLNVLARNLQEMSQLRESEQERLKTLIETMGSGLIVLGRSGDISIMNRPFSEWFTIDFKQAQSKNYQDIGLPKELEKFAYQLLMTETPTRQQIPLDTLNGLRYTECYGAPIIGEYGKWLGMVIVVHDITELKRLEKVRQDFVANVSHELKTPVTSIKGFTETLLYGAYKKEETLLEFLEIIKLESDRLQLLINDLLDLSKMEQQSFELMRRPVSTQTLFQRTLQLTQQASEEKKIAIEPELTEDVFLHADENRLLQVMVNLVSNAITYSSEQTKITLKAWKEDSFGVLEVTDEGIGMEAEELTRIFERFYRIDKARSRNSGGTGLGLAIVKHLVEAHQGKIEVASSSGKGTTFTVFIPLAHS